MSQLSTSQEDRFHFVTYPGRSRPLDKLARQFLVANTEAIKGKSQKHFLNGEHVPTRKHAVKIGSHMSSWRIKKNNTSRQSSRDKITGMPKDDCFEYATQSIISPSLYPTIPGLSHQIPSALTTRLLEWFSHMLVMWRYPVHFRSFSDIPCASQYLIKDRFFDQANLFTTLAAAHSHLQMYKRELGFEPFYGIFSGLHSAAYYRGISLRTIRHDVGNLPRTDRASLIWAICKIALADLFSNDFDTAKIHLTAIAKLVTQNTEGDTWSKMESYQKHILFLVDLNTAAMFLEKPLFSASLQQHFHFSFSLALSFCVGGVTLARRFSDEKIGLDDPFLQNIIVQLRRIIALLEYLMLNRNQSSVDYLQWLTYNINAIDHRILTRISSSSLSNVQEACLISILCLNFTIVKPSSCRRGNTLAYHLLQSLSRIDGLTDLEPGCNNLYLWMVCMGLCVTSCPIHEGYLSTILRQHSLLLSLSDWVDVVHILKGFFYIEHIHGQRLHHWFKDIFNPNPDSA